MGRLSLVATLCYWAVNVVFAQSDLNDIFLMDLQDLSKIKVTSASNTEETLAEAPATMVVLTQQELIDRGYNDLSEMYDDLPGMEVIRPYGDTYFTNYMRGYRYTIGTPFLVMIDGVSFNSMYFGISTPLSTIPLTKIKQVEIVYGPVSSVYGANAFMGVINVITEDDKAKNGHFLDSRVIIGEDSSIITDFTYFYKKDELKVSLSGRREQSDFAHRIDNNSVYWLRDEHYENRELWGDLIDDSSLVSEQFSSYIDTKGIDFRLYYKGWELAAQYWLLDTGYSTIYPVDKILPNSTWPRLQYDTHLTYQKQFAKNIRSKTLIRYRFDGVTNDAFDIEGYNVTNNQNSAQNIGGIELEPDESARFIFMQYWQTQNVGWEFSQDFDLNIFDDWQFNLGFKYTRKDLQKAYDLPSSGAIAPELADPNNEDLFPQPPSTDFDDNNRIVWRDRSAYLQSKYQINDDNIINAGVRLDHNSTYGTNITYRLGYVKFFNSFTAKLLYGEAFQEPVPRSLYGAWVGSGSDPTLNPEASKTYETSLTYRQENLEHLVSLYHVVNSNTIINFSGGARNAGQREVTGIDYHLQYQKVLPFLGSSKMWGYLSLYLSEKEEKFNLATAEHLGDGSIGDLAKTKLQFGMTSHIKDNVQLTLTSRYISDRKTVDSNPIKKIDAYWVADANLIFKNFLTQGLNISFRITNLFNRHYFHPGIRDANAGEPLLTTNDFEDIGFSGPNNREWSGSKGWYNSRLPQPERRLTLSIALTF